MTELPRISPLHELLMKEGRRLKLPKEQALGSSDDRQDVIMVEKGFIKRFLISNQGALGIQIIYGPSDVFPLTLAYRVLLNQSLYDGPEIYHYRAMTDSIVYAMQQDAFVEAVKQNPLIYRDLFSEAGQHLATTIQRLENIALKSSYKRVAHILLFYTKKFGQQTAQGTCLTMPLTHQDIADILSVSRETVSVCMVTLRKKKIIKTGRNVVVPDIERLFNEAYY